MRDTWKWKKENKFDGWIDTSTIFLNGKIRDATREELVNIEEEDKEEEDNVMEVSEDEILLGFMHRPIKEVI